MGSLRLMSAGGEWCHAPVLCLIFLLSPWCADAHELARSESKLEVRGSTIEGWHLFDLLEFPDVDRNGNNAIEYEELDAAIDTVYQIIKQNLVIGGPGPPVAIEVRRYSLVEDGHVVRLDMAYTFQEPVARVTVVSTLPSVTRPDHLHAVNVTMHGERYEAVLDRRLSSADLSPGSAPGPLRRIRQFVLLGMEHIITGYDHLAFLLLLVLAATSGRSLVVIVTSFTIAHSVTLGLATFDIVVLPGRLVESAIALSIAYVALENLLRVRALPRHYVTFLFGLLHGFGFSNVLREMELPRSDLALSLFSFNFGVEIGQVLFVLVAYPLLSVSLPKQWPRVRPAVSALVLCLGVYWFVERAFVR